MVPKNSSVYKNFNSQVQDRFSYQRTSKSNRINLYQSLLFDTTYERRRIERLKSSVTLTLQRPKPSVTSNDLSVTSVTSTEIAQSIDEAITASSGAELDSTDFSRSERTEATIMVASTLKKQCLNLSISTSVLYKTFKTLQATVILG